ncbi:cordon-bleu protein-like 1 [Lethenteron reissneri]|uniref:cordon-bleu protein-like 1 n=1 Tax=Lethenteron reissneri TaxID=7753 RepID=UPI002AB78E9B|nr:cordon-bleu protein-like 1 [Lethenteron reissneri]
MGQQQQQQQRPMSMPCVPSPMPGTLPSGGGGGGGSKQRAPGAPVSPTNPLATIPEDEEPDKDNVPSVPPGRQESGFEQPAYCNFSTSQKILWPRSAEERQKRNHILLFTIFNPILKTKPRAPLAPPMSQSETEPPNLDPPDLGGGGALPVENVELGVILPGGERHVSRFHGSKPVMDVLVVLCGRYRLSPAGHTLELLSRDDASPLRYKPHTPLGALGAGTALIKPRPASDDRLKKPTQPVVVPEQTVRLTVNYLRTQKTTVRVSPSVALQALLPEICNKCGFHVPHTTLFRDAGETEALDASRSLSELGVEEVYAVDRSKELSHGLHDNTDLPAKKKKGLFSFLWPKKKKTSMPGTPLMGQQQQQHQRPMSMPCVPSPMPGTLPSGGGGGGGGGGSKRRAPGAPVSPTNSLATIPEDEEPDKDNVPSVPPGRQESGFELSSPDQPRLAPETRRSQPPAAPLAASSTEATATAAESTPPSSPPPRSAPEHSSAAFSQPGSSSPVTPSAENQHRRRSSSTETTLNEGGGGMGSDSNVAKQQCVPEAALRRLEQETSAKSETRKTSCGASQQAQDLADNTVQECSSDLVQADTDAAATAELDQLIAELEMGLMDDDLRSESSSASVETVNIIKAEADVNFIAEPVRKPEAALPDSAAIKATCRQRLQ